MQTAGVSDQAGLVAAPRAGWVEDIVAHLVQRVGAVDVQAEPYQHFYLTETFPADVYTEMRRRLPARECYIPLNIKRWKDANGRSTRDRICLDEAELGRVPDEHRAFWAGISQALASRELQQAVYGRMRQDVSIRLGCTPDDVLGKPAWTSVTLVRDFEEYKLKPHPDGHPRVVTMLFYLAKDGDPDDVGTSVYRKKPLINQMFGDTFEEVRRFPFLPNSACAFAVNDSPKRRSWHGCEYISGASIVRDTLQAVWLYKESPDFGKKHAY